MIEIKNGSRFIPGRISKFLIPAFLILILLALVTVFAILIMSVSGFTPGT